MPPAEDAHAPARARSYRLVLVRGLLLGACGVGMLGLTLPHSPTVVATTVQAGASSSVFRASELGRTPVIVVPRVTAHRASRSRPVVAKKKPVPIAAKWVRPSAAAIISPFGMRWGRMHKGVDFGAHYGDPIVAIGDGEVVGAGYLPNEGGYGQITLIRHPNGFVSAYAHQSRMLVHAGQHVTAGETIGFIGATGHVTGPHLHFEIRTSTHDGQINPIPWFLLHGVSV